MSICPPASQDGVLQKKTAFPRQAIDMNKDQEKEELLIEISRLRQELRQKSLDLKYTEMARDAYEQMILLAEKRYGLPIRKKCDAK